MTFVVCNRLLFTPSYDGCEYVQMYTDHEDPDHVVLVERWASRAHYDKYREWATAQTSTQEGMQAAQREMTILYLDETGA